MNVALIVLAVIAGILLGLVPWIVGIVLSRRAYSRWRWPEARLLFLAFLSKFGLYIAGAITLPLVGWLVQDSYRLFNWIATLISLVNAIPMIVIAIGLYRLAKRARYASQPPASTKEIEPSGSRDALSHRI